MITVEGKNGGLLKKMVYKLLALNRGNSIRSLQIVKKDKLSKMMTGRFGYKKAQVRAN
jgi:hypothetical protein